MLSRANAEFAARQSALPALSVLLDPEAAAERLRAAWPEVTSAAPVYIRHKPGANTTVLLRAETAAGARLFHARAFRRDEDGKREKALAQADAAFADIAAAVFAFPNDSALPALAQLFDDAKREALLARILKAAPELSLGDATVLSYKPLRRCVARLDLDGLPRAVLRFHSAAEFPAKAQIARRDFGGADAPILPKPLGVSNGRCAVAYAWLPGRSLAQSPDASEDVFGRVGAALARLHRLDGVKLPARLWEEERAALEAQAGAIAGLAPEAGPQAIEATREIGRRLPPRPAHIGFAHGDFAPAQVLLDGDLVAIIDLDEAHLGDPALDVAHFLATLEAEALTGSGGDADRAAAAFLDGYAAAGGAFPTAIRGPYVAWGLLRLATQPFRLLTPDWPAAIAAIVDRAARLAAAGRFEAPE